MGSELQASFLCHMENQAAVLEQCMESARTKAMPSNARSFLSLMPFTLRANSGAAYAELDDIELRLRALEE